MSFYQFIIVTPIPCPPMQAKTRSSPIEASSEKASAAYSAPDPLWWISKSNCEVARNGSTNSGTVTRLPTTKQGQNFGL